MGVLFWKPCCPVSWGIWHPNSVTITVLYFLSVQHWTFGSFPVFCVLVRRKMFRRFSEKCFPWCIFCVSIPNIHTVLPETFRIRTELFCSTRKLQGKRHITGLAWASSYFPMLGKLIISGRLRLKCDGTRAETRFRLSTKQTCLFKSAGGPVQSTTGSRGLRISGSNTGYTMFRGSMKGTDYPFHSPVSPSLPLSCVTVCHHVSTGLYYSVRHARYKASHYWPGMDQLVFPYAP